MGLLAGCHIETDSGEKSTYESVVQTEAPQATETQPPIEATELPEEVTVVQTEPTVPEEVTEPASEKLPYLETIPHADQSIFNGPSYDHQMVRTVEKAGIYTIVEEVWDEEGNLWGKLKSGAGWVDLSEIRSEESKNMPITANYADKRLLKSGDYHHCTVSTSEYTIQVAFRAYETLTNVSLFPMFFEGDGFTEGEPVYTLSELTPSKPLVADIEFPGDLSMYGIRFNDEHGNVRLYCVMTSGRNNTLAFWEEV